jgi:electron transfer flavoprotein beta subunit
MNIVVTVKQVPNTQEVKIDPKTGTLMREGVPSIINPDDKNAIEEALRLKETPLFSTVIALSMGPPQAASALREALAMGVDQAILVTDKDYAGADTLATAYILSVAIKKIEKYGLILCGSQAIDGDTAQVGPQLAEFLKLPQVTFAEEIKVDDDVMTVKSNFDRIIRTIEVKPPTLVTVTKRMNKPRYKTMNGVWRAFRDKQIVTWTKKDLKANPLRIGINGSPTMVRKTSVPTHSRGSLVTRGNAVELADSMLKFLTDHNLLSS